MKREAIISLFVVAIATLVYLAFIPQVTSISVRNPNDVSSVRNFGRDHRIQLNENRVLYYNGEERCRIPEGKKAVLRASRFGNPSISIEDI